MKNTIIVLILVAAVFGAGFYFFLPVAHLPEELSTGEAQIGGSFTLTDQNGKQVSDRQFRGKYMLVFFGFTSCPSICPVGMATITQVMEKLEVDGDASKVQPIFISVDPETDTPAKVKEYLSNFHSSIIGLTGTPEQIKAVESAYKVYAAKSANKDMPGGYNVDHSGFIYLMDKNGEYLRHCSYDEKPEKLASDIEEAIH